MNEEFRKKRKLGILPHEPNLDVEAPKKAPRPKDEYIPHPLAHISTPASEAPVKQSFPKQKKKPRQRGKGPQRPHLTKRATLIALACLLILGGGIGGYLIIGKSKKEPVITGPFTQPSTEEISLPVYFPRNLPKGYTYQDDARSIKKDVYYYSVKGPKDTMLYVTQQAIPEQFDFREFNKKFLNPEKFDASSGAVIAGQAGANYIASITTKKNTWILINSTTIDTLSQVEVVARSLEL